MNKILALLLFSIMNTVAIVESQEICESYSYNGLYFYESQNCSMYCCGSCNARYCCSDLSNRLDQKSCTPENCDGYYDIYGNFKNLENCSEQFCCGSCDSRYCCSYSTVRLNQSSCLLEIPTARNSTSSYWSHSLTIFYYVFAAISIIFIICFVTLILYKKSKRRGFQRTPENNNNEISLEYPGTQFVNEYNGYNNRYNNNGNVSNPTNITAQPNTRSAFVVADNSAYNYDINKIYNQNLNELPPSYDTINVQQKNTGDTNETNL